MHRRVTVFLCGTHRDLVPERNAVIQAIRELQAEHDTMEFFGARPHPPLATCLEEVGRSDVLVVIVGHRYGDFAPGREVSFTEAEYEEGIRLDKPCLVYLRREDVPILPGDFEQNPRGLEGLKRFKETLLTRHTPAWFSGPEDLADRVRADLEPVIEAVDADTRKAETGLDFHAAVDGLLRDALKAGVGEATLLTAVRSAVSSVRTTSERTPARVFLSHAPADAEIAQRLRKALGSRGVEVWPADRTPSSDDHIVHQLEAGLEGADIVVLLISTNSLGRKVVHYELNYVIAHRLSASGGATVLPVRLDDVTVPSVLRDVRELDLKDGDVERAAQEIVNIAEQRHDRARRHTDRRAYG
ncbi:MAG: TIR domain-containing protein [Longimicrobiaceae bacterium]